MGESSRAFGRLARLDGARLDALMREETHWDTEFKAEARLWFMIAGGVSFVLWLTGIAHSLELYGFLAVAMQWLPGPILATLVSGVRWLASRSPNARAYMEERALEHASARAALQQELELVGQSRHPKDVKVEIFEFEAARAWVDASGRGLLLEGPQGLAWLDRVPRHLLSAEGLVPTRWRVERLFRSQRLLDARAQGPSLQAGQLQAAHAGPSASSFGNAEVLPRALIEANLGSELAYRR